MNKGKRMTRRMREWMMEHAYLVTLGAVIAVMAASAVYTKHMQNDVQAAAGAPEIGTSAAVTITPEPKVTPMPTIAPLQVRYEALGRSAGTVWPLEGEIVRAYDVKTPVLWEALSCVQVHAGLDIAGAGGEGVRCAADGVVQKTARDALWGWRVYVAQTDGYEAVYAGLGSCDVETGQTVTRGQQLGVLMEDIPCEAEWGAHLHMELWQDGAQADPQLILPVR